MSTISAPSRPMAARGLGDHKHSSSSSTGTITLMAQSLDPSATSTPNLFPTTTAGRGDSGTGGPGSANVYYLVFLGVLVIILMLAACLAFRAFRMRRRYRTATQIALARGDPLPMQLRDDYWGLAGLPGFIHGTDGGGGGVITGESRGKRGTWTKIPILEEAEVDGVAPEYSDELFEDITPVTLHSLLAPPDPAIAIAEAQSQFDLDQAGFSPSRTRRFQLANLRRLANPSSPGPYNIPESEPRPRTKSSKQKEIDRVIQEGEDMRLAVVIQMPTQQDKAKKRQSWASDEADEEEVAWETGMELGVWEGTVRR